MEATASPVLRDVVLIGGGHSHVGVLHMFAMKPLPGVRLTVICTDTDTPYSGMLPGYIAGHYSFADVHIDLRRLAEFAGARYYRDEVVGLDRNARRVLCRHRPPVPYDVLSINIGSTPQLGHVAGDSRTELVVDDIVRAVSDSGGEWDAILLDVDNGPSFLIHDENARVYSADFLATCLARLAPGGRLVIWCEQASPDLEITLRRLTKSVQLIPIPVTREGRSFEYALYRALAR